MYSIKNNIDNTIIIKKSKFITKLYKINEIFEIKDIIDNLKGIYKDATHICYAYIINGQEKCFDDGEPSGTAGLPILNVLKKNDLNCILCVVIRYFGGIKLGAGGLVRAYANSVNETLKLVDKVNLIPGKNITIKFNYKKIKVVDNILKDTEIIDKKFNDNVIYNINISDLDFNTIKNILKDLCNEIKINFDVSISK